MADITQSSAQTATTLPGYYNDYLSNLASKGTAAGAAVNSGAWAPNSLQNQSYANAQNNVGNYRPGLDNASWMFGRAGNTDATGATQPFLDAGTNTSGLSQANPYLSQGSQGANQIVGDYMNPYTQNVVDQIGKANQQNIAQNLSPSITAGAVGSGQFGSQRGANALAMGISNADIGALSQQNAALQSGYAQSLAAAQAQRANQLTAGSTAGNLQSQANQNTVNAGQVAGNVANTQGQLQNSVGANQMALAAQQQKSGLLDTNALSSIGALQQGVAQKQQMMPLDVLGKQAGLMNGAQLPQNVTQTMHASPLSTISGLAGIAGGVFSKPANGGDSLGTQGLNWLSNKFGSGTADNTPLNPANFPNSDYLSTDTNPHATSNSWQTDDTGG